ncbi:hypothetical protein XI05_29885 [Bradyrhizobium sp. CCBAU 11357]|nr:hypothetical protein [Bradyrhizobium sp. CCBAU 11357]
MCLHLSRRQDKEIAYLVAERTEVGFRWMDNPEDGIKLVTKCSKLATTQLDESALVMVGWVATRTF